MGGEQRSALGGMRYEGQGCVGEVWRMVERSTEAGVYVGRRIEGIVRCNRQEGGDEIWMIGAGGMEVGGWRGCIRCNRQEG